MCVNVNNNNHFYYIIYYRHNNDNIGLQQTLQLISETEMQGKGDDSDNLKCSPTAFQKQCGPVCSASGTELGRSVLLFAFHQGPTWAESGSALPAPPVPPCVLCPGSCPRHPSSYPTVTSLRTWTVGCSRPPSSLKGGPCCIHLRSLSDNT